MLQLVNKSKNWTNNKDVKVPLLKIGKLVKLERKSQTDKGVVIFCF